MVDENRRLFCLAVFVVVVFVVVVVTGGEGELKGCKQN